MLTEVRLRNFRCFEDHKIPLRKLTVIVKQPRNLLVRVPDKIAAGTLKVSANGKVVEGTRVGIYLSLPNDRRGTTFTVTFGPERYDTFEHVYHKPHQVSWFGEQVIGISPQEGVYPLYGEWPGG